MPEYNLKERTLACCRGELEPGCLRQRGLRYFGLTYEQNYQS